MLRITEALSPVPEGTRVSVCVDRHQLARRRWRGTAEDGTEFGIDVVEALRHGDAIHACGDKVYCIEQSPEGCCLVPLKQAPNAAHLGWQIGNLHFKAAFSEEGILVSDDSAVVQMLEREGIPFTRVQRIFQPARQGGHSHHHDHAHAHEHEH